MRPNPISPRTTETKAQYEHNKKIQKRVDDFMGTVKKLAFSPTGKLTILKFLLDNTAVVLSNTKAAEKFNDKFHHFTNELDLAVKESKKPKNQEQFLRLLRERIARDGLGSHYDEYATLRNSGATTEKLLAWISEKQKEINPPKVRQRSQSQPTMLVSTSTPTQAPPMTASQAFVPMVSNAPAFSMPAPPFAPSSAQHAYPPMGQYPASSAPCPSPAMPPQAHPPAYAQSQPQPQPQPYGQASTVAPATQPAFSVGGKLNDAQMYARENVFKIFKRANFNAKGTITLLKYLVNGDRPRQGSSPEAKRFNNKLSEFIDSYEFIRVGMGEEKHTQWAYECLIEIAESKLPDHVEELADKVTSQDRQSVVTWLNTLY